MTDVPATRTARSEPQGGGERIEEAKSRRSLKNLFRLWRRRQREAWPSVAQTVLMGLAGGVLAAGGCGGWAVLTDTSLLLPLAIALFAVFVLGLAFAIGAGELFVISVFRLIFRRPGAR